MRAKERKKERKKKVKERTKVSPLADLRYSKVLQNIHHTENDSLDIK